MTARQIFGDILICWEKSFKLEEDLRRKGRGAGAGAYTKNKVDESCGRYASYGGLAPRTDTTGGNVDPAAVLKIVELSAFHVKHSFVLVEGAGDIDEHVGIAFIGP